MARYAIVEGGIVTNVVLWSGDLGDWTPPPGSTPVLLEDGQLVNIGWSWDGLEFYPPPD